jgi:hypothetical protein
MGDVSKLPKWAQDHIRHLEMTIQRHEERINELSSIFPDTNVKVTQHHIYPDVTLPPDSSVDFYMGESRERYRDMLTVKHDSNCPGWLDLHGSNGRLIVAASSSNSFRVRIADL